MSQLGDGGELCFELDKPLIGKPAGRVCVTPFGEVHIEHRMLKTPVVVSASRLAAVLKSEQFDEVPAFEREPVQLHLPRDAFTPPNIALVMRAPVPVGPFKYGSQQLMPLTRRQRKEGLAVDVLALTVADPTLLVEALRSVGVASTGGLRAALAQSLPLASPEVAAEVLDARRRRVRAAARKQVILGTLFAILLATRIALPAMPWESVVRLIAATLAASALVALAMGLRASGGRDASRARRWGPALALAPIAVIAGLFVLGRSHQLSGAAYLLSWSVAGALICGPVIGVGWRTFVASRPPRETNPMISQPTRWPSGMAVAALAIAVIAVSARMEESAAAVVRTATSALLEEADLPAGWESCCRGDQISRGHELDEHICGGDDDALPAHEAAVQRSFNKPTVGDPDNLDAHLDISVLLAPTVAAAKAEFAATDRAGYLDCTSASIGKLGKHWQSKATGDAMTSYMGRERMGGTDDAVVDSFQIVVPVGDALDVIWGQFVRVRIGRAIVRMPILSFTVAPLDGSELDAIVQTAIRVVTASDAPDP